MLSLFNNLNIKTKMTIFVTTLLILMISVAVFSLSQMSLISAELQGIIEEDIPLTEITTDITSKQLEGALLLEKSFRGAGVSLNISHEEVTQLLAKFKKINREINNELSEAYRLLKHADKSAISENIVGEISLLKTTLANLQEERLSYENLANSLINNIENNEIDIAKLSVAKLEKLQDDLNRHLEVFLIGVEKLTLNALNQSEAHEKTALYGMALIAFIGVIIGVAFGVIFTNSLTKSLRFAVEASEKMANGDFNITLHSDTKDETGLLLKAMNRMASKLQQTIGQVLNSTHKIATVAEEMAVATEQTNQAINTQQMNTENVASAITEMATTVQQIAASAITTSDASHKAGDEAEKGNQVVLLNQKEIDNLVLQIKAAAEEVELVSVESNAINGFVTSINEIADQTNLLALNAAIEAARAGEQGRGFAVVADEVRNLAKRTQGATTEIHHIIEGLQLKALHAVSVINESSDMVNDSAQRAELARQSLVAINHSVSEINGMNLEVASVCEQQSATVEEINQNMLNISDSGKEVLEGSHSTSNSSEELALLSVNLRQLMEQFKINNTDNYVFSLNE